ncbi:hypothetical protein [Porphyrobacter sp. TH134]|uniref:hypothetical protein n=1 Tax=Porphyrobacter sp. TH134 TaxID=2067450 RepID=UPI001552C1C7|nr:hypothetical protein [Porphyrobacter sp. TH134]
MRNLAIMGSQHGGALQRNDGRCAIVKRAVRKSQALPQDWRVGVGAHSLKQQCTGAFRIVVLAHLNGQARHFVN